MYFCHTAQPQATVFRCARMLIITQPTRCLPSLRRHWRSLIAKFNSETAAALSLSPDERSLAVDWQTIIDVLIALALPWFVAQSAVSARDAVVSVTSRLLIAACLPSRFQTRQL